MCSVYFDIIIPLKYKNFYFWFTQTGKRNFCLFFKLSIKKKNLKLCLLLHMWPKKTSSLQHSLIGDFLFTNWYVTEE